ncbi:hypothetical protein QAD02_015437 [Eretmocerus hayati]|uniref:Uncharacterized protein n=1 Tax=Eretmocerus hayati TaxID=131215 RepID=A0ACC2PD08_9HYME|nr:hypothetical protein QAD02_015437 [Eretmocerus hayati]
MALNRINSRCEKRREPPWTPSVASFTGGTLSHNSHGCIQQPQQHLATFQDSRKTQTLDPKNLANLKRGPNPAWNQAGRPLPVPNPTPNNWDIESRSQTNMNQFRSLVRNKQTGLSTRQVQGSDPNLYAVTEL